MAGHPRFNACVTQLEVEACSAGVEVIEWVVDQIASNKTTLVKMSEDFTRKTGKEISRQILTRAIAKLCPDYERALEAARREQAHAMIEESHSAVMDLDGGSSKEEIAAEALKMRSSQWIAERFNRSHFGTNLRVEHEIGPQALHLAVIRERSLLRSRELASLPETPVEVLANPETVTDPESLI